MIISHTDERLRASNSFVDFEKDNVLLIFEDLSRGMIENNGWGLSAPQIGVNKQAFVFGDPKNPDQIIGVFNPKVIDMSEETTYIAEGCLSWPGLSAKVRRSAKIKVRFTSLNNERRTVELSGLSARVFLHEYDHLDGKMFFDDISKMRKDIIMKRCKKKYGIEYRI